MDSVKKFKYFGLAMLLCGFVLATSLTGCNSTGQKESDTEQTDSAATQDEHPTDTAGEEHPDN